MQLLSFNYQILLQAIGWGVFNSLWQAALCWLLYQLVGNVLKSSSALFRYYSSVLLVAASASWFIVTVIRQYIFLQQSADPGTGNWLHVSADITQGLHWLSIAYLLALGYHGIRFVRRFGFIGQFLHKHSVSKPPVDARLYVRQTAFQLGIKKQVQVWISTMVDVPSVIGFFKPVILIPASCISQLTTKELESILLHELAHIKRNDYLVNWLLQLMQVLLFFNPFVRKLVAAAAIERENCCDDWVLNFGYNRQAYATALFTLEQQRQKQLQLALAATNGKHLLLNRIKRMVAVEPTVQLCRRNQFGLRIMTVCILFALAVFIPIKENAVLQMPISAADSQPFATPIATNYVETTNPGLKVENDIPAVAKRLPKHFKKKRILPSIEALPTGTIATAYINDVLLHSPAMATPVAVNNAASGEQQLFIQVVEEQAGSHEKTSYIMSIDNNGGSTSVTPLIILHKAPQASAVKDSLQKKTSEQPISKPI